MAVDFSDYFWGEKNEGFHVLYQNMKCGWVAAKDLSEFLRENAKIQEENAKIHAKLAKQLNTGGATGTFSPLLLAFRSSAEKLALIHNQWSTQLNELTKDVTKYAEDLHRLHKKIKDDESNTLEAVKNVQEATTLLIKTKESYKQRCQEVEKMRREGVVGAKDLEKAEAKFRRMQDDYKCLADKYGGFREDFERKMTSAAQRFQEVETTHLRRMRQYVETYCQVVDHSNNQIGRVYHEFQIQLTELTVENLLEQFTLNKHTGLEKPGAFEFDDEKISLTSATGPSSDISSDRSGNSTTTERKGGGGGGGDCSSLGGNSISGTCSLTSVTALGTPVATGVNSQLTTSSSSSTAPEPVTNELPKGLPETDNNCELNCNPDMIEDTNLPDITKSFTPATSSTPNVPPPTLFQEPEAQTVIRSGSDALTPVTTTSHTSISFTSTVSGSAPAAGDSTEPGEELSPTRSPYPHIGNWTVSGFLRRNRRKDKKKKSSSIVKDEDTAGSEGCGGGKGEIGSDGDDTRKSETPTPDVDDEGYSRQPSNLSDPSADDPWADLSRPQRSFYSSSDDSEDDDYNEKRKLKMKVEIKPATTTTNGSIGVTSASVDELRSVVGGMALPLPAPRESGKVVNQMWDGNGAVSNNRIRRSHSQANVNKPSHDLLGLTLHPIDPIDPPPTNPDEPSPADTSTVSRISGTGHSEDISNTSSTSKEVQAIFCDLGEPLFQQQQQQQPVLPPKQRPSSVQREKISNSLIALPRPPSRLSSGGAHRHRASPPPSCQAYTGTPHAMTEPDPSSVSSLFNDIRQLSTSFDGKEAAGDPDEASVGMRKSSLSSQSSLSARSSTPLRCGLSRGPSPLTLSLSEVVPLAVAFQEVCHACFRGSDEKQVKVRVIGDLMVSFPAGIVNVIANNVKPTPQLSFRIINSSALESVVPNKQLVSHHSSTDNDSSVFEFNMKSLKELLKSQADQNPKASYFNVDILKYQVKAKSGAGSCPLHMVAYWKCESAHTDLRVDYKYSPHTMATPSPLLNLSIAVPIDGGVTNMQSQPTGLWLEESRRALWKFNELSQQDNSAGVGSLRGRFQLKSGPGSQGTIAAQFNCEGTTLSGVDFELVSPGYRLSLVKKRFVSGKYICDGNAISSSGQSRYAVPPPGDTMLDTNIE